MPGSVRPFEAGTAAADAEADQSAPPGAAGEESSAAPAAADALPRGIVGETTDAASAASTPSPAAAGDATSVAAEQGPRGAERDARPSRYPNSEEVYHCLFDAESDPNFDGWPRGWTRRTGPGYPHYVKMSIAGHEEGPDGTPPLRIDLDGGAAALYSPAVEIEHQASYVLEVEVQTAGLKFDEVRLSITWLDAKQQPLGTVESPAAVRNQDWQTLVLGPVSAHWPQARFARVGLHINPVGGQDLRGVVRFDDVWLARLPRIEVQTARPNNLFTEPDQVEIHCRLTGLREHLSQVRFDLFDVHGVKRQSAEEAFGQRHAPTAGAARPAIEFARGSSAADWTITWRPRLAERGYYRVVVTMGDSQHPLHQRVLNLAVVDPQRAAIAGEFGWTLPAGFEPLGPQAMAQLLSHAGVSWVKLPVWVEEQDLGELTWFIDRLKLTGIETVGLLADPPAGQRQKLQLSPGATAADVFTPAPETTPAPDETATEANGPVVINWYQSLEPVLVQLALRVRWWQLGNETDLSLFGYPHLASKVQQIKRALDLTGQDANLGFPWSWIYEPPEGQPAPWRFLAMSAEPPLTPTELGRHLQATAQRGYERWVALPVSVARGGTVEERAAGLLRRMVAAKVHGAQRIFVPDPFAGQGELMHPDGTPGELFLPWRTMALALAGTTYAGSWQLAGGSENHLFLRDDEALLVVWNDRPVEELAYLGETPRQLGLWGGSRPVEAREGQHVLAVGPLPSVITGLQSSVARLQLAMVLERSTLDNIPDLPQRNTLKIKSFFQQGASGKLTIHAPSEWRVRPRVLDVNLAAGETVERPLDVLLGFDAETGTKPLHLEFDLVADRRYHFHVTRWLSVGSGDVSLEVVTRLNEYGELEVEQRLNNRTGGPISYNCDLFAPDRRRQRVQLVRQPVGESTKLFRFRDGVDLLGQTLRLRAQELGGRHVLNYHVVARP